MTEKQTTKTYDCLIVGGGMAGISAGLWCLRLGLKPLLLDNKESAGGTLRELDRTFPDYPGWTGNSRDLAHFIDAQYRDAGGSVMNNVTVTRIVPGKVSLNDIDVHGRSILIATGVARRKLHLIGESLNGVIYSAASKPADFAGKRIVIVGGGDGALENASVLSDYAGSIDVIIRKTKAAARPEFIESIKRKGNVTIHYDSVVIEITGKKDVSGAIIKKGNTLTSLDSDLILFKIGFEPVSNLVQDICERDERGYIVVDKEQRTSHPGIWAAGDVCCPLDPSLIVSAAQGAVAARSIERYLR